MPTTIGAATDNASLRDKQLSALAPLKEVHSTWSTWYAHHTHDTSDLSRSRMAPDFQRDGCTLFAHNMIPICCVRSPGSRHPLFGVRKLIFFLYAEDEETRQEHRELIGQYLQSHPYRMVETTESESLEAVFNDRELETIQRRRAVGDRCASLVKKNPPSINTFYKFHPTYSLTIYARVYVFGQLAYEVTYDSSGMEVVSEYEDEPE